MCGIGPNVSVYFLLVVEDDEDPIQYRISMIMAPEIGFLCCFFSFLSFVQDQIGVVSDPILNCPAEVSLFPI